MHEAKVVAIAPFPTKAEHGREYRVHTFERLTILSAFGFMKLKTRTGQFLHCDERYSEYLIKEENYDNADKIQTTSMGFKRIYPQSPKSPTKKEFIEAEEMMI